METNVLFYNKKGGQGKTTLAVNYSKYKNGNFITNDVNNFTEEVFKISASMIEENTKIEDVEIESSRSNIFDFGGFTDERVEIVAGFCDVCVVPIYYQGAIDLRAAQETMATLKKENENSIFVINNTDKSLVEELFQHLSKISKTFVIPHSSYLQENSEGIYEIYSSMDNPLQRYTLGKKVIPFFDDLFNYLGKEK